MNHFEQARHDDALSFEPAAGDVTQGTEKFCVGSSLHKLVTERKVKVSHFVSAGGSVQAVVMQRVKLNDPNQASDIARTETI